MDKEKSSKNSNILNETAGFYQPAVKKQIIMKNAILSLLSIVFCCFVSRSQTGIINYSLDIPSFKTDQREKAKKILAEVELMSFSLYYSKDESFFKKNKHIPIDHYYANIALIFAQALEASHQYVNNRKVFENTEIKNKMYQVDYSYKMKDWELTSETKKIENYTCYKAILTEVYGENNSIRKTIAWYTPEIPVPFGPAGYGGLPGLILQLEFMNSIYTANKVILNPKENISIPKLKEGIQISTKEKTVLMRKARKVTED